MPSEQELVSKELKEINWNEVDEFPSIEECKKIEDAKQRQSCFFEILTQLIQDKLVTDSISVFAKKDSMDVKVTILPDSSLLFESQKTKDSIPFDTKKTDSILKLKLVDFPKINPAIKRGIPVKTQFILSISLKAE